MNTENLLKNLPEAYLLLDKEGIISYANTAAERVTGYSSAELMGQPHSIFNVNTSDTIKPAHELTMALANNTLQYEGWKVRKDGSQYWAKVLLAPVFEHNEVAGFSCVLNDMTEAKQQEWSLKQNEEHYRLMVQSVRDYAIFMLDKDGYILTWNEGARRIKGYMASEIVGKHFSTFYTAKDLDDKKPERELRIAIKTGKYEEEGWRVKKDGSLFWANIVITALFDTNNQVVGFSKVTRDLTDRKKNEEALRQSEERYRLLVEQVTDYAIFLLDEKGRIASWNEGARRIKGYLGEEVIGKYFSIFYSDEDKLAGKPAYELKVAVTNGKYEEEGWRLRKDGSQFWANVIITPVYNAQKQLLGFAKVTRDLTEKKMTERALSESHHMYRTLADELKTKNEELMYANQELKQFTSVVSHDLQEPIRTVKSFLTLIDTSLSKTEQADLRHYIKRALDGAERMKLLIHNLLHYSQLSKGELERQPVDVSILLNEALQNIKSLTEATGASIAIENDLDTVSGDPVQLLQLIQNLLSNALKFTNGQVPQIKLKSYMEDNTPKFSISDNGIGIAAADLEKIFDIFKRLNTSPKYPGTGIGLAICKKIVDRHHGRIWPESTPGKGTTFYFTLNEDIKNPTLLQ